MCFLQLAKGEKEQMTPHGPTGRKAPFTPADVAAIRQHLASAGTARDRALFETGLSTMLRAGDLLSLRVRAVTDYAGIVLEQVTVRQEKASTRSRMCRSVVVRLNPAAREAIAELIKTEGKQSSDPLFTRPAQPHGRPLCTMTLRSLTKSWAMAAGLDPATVAAHSLRRTRPVLIYQQTKDVEAVRILLGHSNLDSTSSYLGIGQSQALALSAQFDL